MTFYKTVLRHLWFIGCAITWFLCAVLSPGHAQGVVTESQQALIDDGRRLFFDEDFNGNGRTCGTCHRAERSFTLDPAFIAILHHSVTLHVPAKAPL